MDSYTNITPDGGEGFGPAIDTATAVVDGRGSVLVWSASAQRLLGYAAGDVVGRPAATLLASALPASARRCPAQPRDWPPQASLRHRGGGRGAPQVPAHPSRGSDGRLRCVLGD